MTLAEGLGMLFMGTLAIFIGACITYYVINKVIENEDNIDNFVYKTRTTNRIDPRLESLKKLK